MKIPGDLAPSPYTSELMSRIRARNTAPEIAVRGLLRSLGQSGYRLHRKDLPGRPDIAFIGRRKAIFVHGCYWHHHTCEIGRRIPKRNQGFWLEKFKRNEERDQRKFAELVAQGWSVLVIWECELSETRALMRRLRKFLSVSP